MAKNKAKKKRNKQYRGEDAATQSTKVTKISVPQRSKAGKWWHENRKTVSRRLAIIGVIVLMYGLISLIF